MFSRTTNFMIGVSILALVSVVASNVQAKDKTYEFCPTGVVVGFDEKGNFLCADEVCAAPCERYVSDLGEVTCDCRRTVFVTSESVYGNLEGSSIDTGDLVGLDKADAICQGLAEAAELDGEYKAWLSDSVSSPSTRFNRVDEDYIDVTETVIAHGYYDLTNADLTWGDYLRNPIWRDEKGQEVINTHVWTNTLPNGSPDSLSEYLNCDNWTEKTIAYDGFVGETHSISSEWTTMSTPVTCTSPLLLYCFEQ